MINQELPKAQVVQRVQEHLGEKIKVIAQECIAERIVDIRVLHIGKETVDVPAPRIIEEDSWAHQTLSARADGGRRHRRAIQAFLVA